MTTEVRTPFSTSAVELSGGGLYRKQILEFRTIDYVDPRTGKRRKLTFSPDYGRKIVDAFRAGAYPQVPFQLADGDNRHNNDPRNTGGEVVGVELSADGSGVDGILRLWGDGARVIESNPKLGVSARLFENLATTDGRTFPVAMQHVLGTVDPQMRDMRPWEKVDSVDLANNAAVTSSLDLSTASYERGDAVAKENGGGTVTLELSPEKAARLEALLDEDEALEALSEQLGDDFLDEDEDEEGPEETQLSHPGSEALELASANIEALNTRVLELASQLTSQRVDNDVAEYTRRNLAPAVLELARPLLALETGAVELSTGIPGAGVDPGQVIREVLDAVIELSNSGQLVVDFAESGTLESSDDKSTREALLADWDTYA